MKRTPSIHLESLVRQFTEHFAIALFSTRFLLTKTDPYYGCDRRSATCRTFFLNSIHLLHSRTEVLIVIRTVIHVITPTGIHTIGCLTWHSILITTLIPAFLQPCIHKLSNAVRVLAILSRSLVDSIDPQTYRDDIPPPPSSGCRTRRHRQSG